MLQAHLRVSGIWLEENPGDSKSPNNHLPHTEPNRRGSSFQPPRVLCPRG